MVRLPLYASGIGRMESSRVGCGFHYMLVEQVGWRAAEYGVASTICQWDRQDGEQQSRVWLPLYAREISRMESSRVGCGFHYMLVEQVGWRAAEQGVASTICQWNRQDGEQHSRVWLPLYASGIGRMESSIVGCGFHYMLVEQVGWRAAQQGVASTICQWNRQDGEQKSMGWFPLMLVEQVRWRAAEEGLASTICQRNRQDGEQQSRVWLPLYASGIGRMESSRVGCGFHYMLVGQVVWRAAEQGVASTICQWNRQDREQQSRVWLPLYASGIGRMESSRVGCGFHCMLVEQVGWRAAEQGMASTICQRNRQDGEQQRRAWLPLYASEIGRMESSRVGCGFHYMLVEQVGWRAAEQGVASTICQWNRQDGEQQSRVWLPLYASGIGRMESSRVGCGFHYMLVEQVGWRAAEEGVASTICQWDRQDGEQQSMVWLPLYASGIGRMENSRVGCGFHYMLVEQVGWRAAEQGVASTICQWNRQDGEQQSRVWLPLYASEIGRMESSRVGCGFHYMLVEQVGWRAAEEGVASTICQWDRQDGEQQRRVWLPLYASGIGRMENSRVGCGFHYMLVEQVGWRAAEQGVASTICQWNRQDGEQQRRVWLPLYASGIGRMEAAEQGVASTICQWNMQDGEQQSMVRLPLYASGIGRMESSRVGCGFHYMLEK